MEKELRLLLVALFGAVAQMVDGSLGMGYGVTSTSLLLSVGFGTALASAAVHFSEIFTTLASGLSHLKFGNIDKKILKYLALSGVLGGAIGAFISVKFQNSAVIKPFVSGVLLVMGIFILVEHIARKKFDETLYTIPRIRRLVPLGFVAAFIDAIGGGGWGPIATPALVITNTHPRKAIGSVNLAEFFVTLTISLTFFLTLPQMDYSVVIPLTIGALLVSPFAAALSRKANHRTLSIFVGVVITVLSARTIVKSLGWWFPF